MGRRLQQCAGLLVCGATPCYAFLPLLLAGRSVVVSFSRDPLARVSPVYIHAEQSSETAFDEFGLPLERQPRPPREEVDVKESFYTALDAFSGVVHAVGETVSDVLESSDPVTAYGVSSERRVRRIRQTTPRKIEQRRASNKALVAKDNVLRTFGAIVDLPNLPRKAWTKYVSEPIQASRDKERRRKAERRAALEAALERYFQAKNVFYDTLDTIADTTRASVNAATALGKAVVEAPERVNRTVTNAKAFASNVVEGVQRTSSNAADVASKVQALPGQVTGTVNDQVRVVNSAWASVRGLATKIKGTTPTADVNTPVELTPVVNEISTAERPKTEGEGMKEEGHKSEPTTIHATMVQSEPRPKVGREPASAGASAAEEVVTSAATPSAPFLESAKAEARPAALAGVDEESTGVTIAEGASTVNETSEVERIVEAKVGAIDDADAAPVMPLGAAGAEAEGVKDDLTSKDAKVDVKGAEEVVGR